MLRSMVPSFRAEMIPRPHIPTWINNRRHGSGTEAIWVTTGRHRPAPDGRHEAFQHWWLLPVTFAALAGSMLFAAESGQYPNLRECCTGPPLTRSGNR